MVHPQRTVTNPRIHPYGDNHAFCINASANTLSIHHCLMHRFVMRGPQFECNDMRSQDRYTVRMEAVNNVISGYTQSGSPLLTRGREKTAPARERPSSSSSSTLLHPREGEAKAIEAISRHGDGRQCSLRHEWECPAGRGMESPERPPPPSAVPQRRHAVRPGQRADTRNLLQRMGQASSMKNSGGVVFEPPVPVTMSSARDACRQVLAFAGDSKRNDPIDARVRREVISAEFRRSRSLSGRGHFSSLP